MNDHQPVLLNEVIEQLAIRADGIYIEGTFGRGGHSKEILQYLGNNGRLLAFDKDPEAIEVAQNVFKNDSRFCIYHGSFTELYQQAQAKGWVGKVDGILLDLGVSSPQLDKAERGFSFLREGPLDMRMNTQQGLDATTWLQQVSEAELTKVLKEYGEERFAGRIARAIVEYRQHAEITTTTQLAEIIAKAHPRWEPHKHPATRSFQAIRIAINNELNEVKTVLQQALDVLKPKGRLLVITFHSLEDRIVKTFIRQESGGALPAKLPITEAQVKMRIKRLSGAIRANTQELDQNIRARSATLRVMEKIQ